MIIITMQGDYACENPVDIPEEHIAAWDHPSLDYVNRDDEDIVFTLCHVSIKYILGINYYRFCIITG